MSKKLKQFYNDIYSNDKSKHFLKYRHGQFLSEAHKVAIWWLKENCPDFVRGGSILDFGCGEADFIGLLDIFTNRIGIDFSEKAIEKGIKYPQLKLICGTEDELYKYKNSQDCVVSFGTLEHLEDPSITFKKLVSCLKKTGILIVSCPNFLNVRGIVWMTLVKLFNVPMSLSDKHFLSICDFLNYAKDSNTELIHHSSVDFEVAQGNYFRRDMQKRLTNALRDADMNNSYVENLISWVEDNMPYFAKNELSGAEAIYIFKKLA